MNETLVGTWKLVSATEITDEGDVKDAFGKGATGFLTYTADGRMTAILSHGGRKPLSVPDFVAAPAAECAEAFRTFAAYAGKYIFSGDKVTHHVEAASLQNWVSTDLVRIPRFEENRLILRSTPYLKAGVMVTAELVWERLSGEGAGH
ncbi:MAG TPA: lipocalin-like domain-containing protein [Candidatus Angelobacter sp.]|nr:lipocalin-like domain-containing protein [Candidatus Angelobacter sp.]